MVNEFPSSLNLKLEQKTMWPWLSGLCFLSGCPGPESSWGNLAVPPASKEAVSPSHVFCSILWIEAFASGLVLWVCTKHFNDLVYFHEQTERVKSKIFLLFMEAKKYCCVLNQHFLEDMHIL